MAKDNSSKYSNTANELQADISLVLLYTLDDIITKKVKQNSQIFSLPNIDTNPKLTAIHLNPTLFLEIYSGA
jgi:hypothetical protein